MSDIETKRQALATLDSRLAAGDIGGDEYQQLRTLLISGLTPDQCARLGVTPTPSPQRASLAGFGPSGGQTRMPSISELQFMPGTVLLDQWKIVREIGRGGFGAVFQAEDVKLERILAVKVLDPSMAARSELLARFRREVTLMREIAHERIVRVFDYREEASENLALITMEFVGGCSVDDVLKTARSMKKPVSVSLALAIFEQTLEALAAAHERGVIHRDVTPSNILLAGGGAAELLADPVPDPKVKLVDFGIAGLVERSTLSARSRVLGTAAYVAPEVLDPDAQITTEADMFGAGAVAYELLTGKTPIVTGYRSVIELRDDVPAFLADVINRSIQPLPEERPSPMDALQFFDGHRAEQDAASRKHEQLVSLQARVSRAMRDKDEADLKEACQSLREALGSKAVTDELLLSAEMRLELWNKEQATREEKQRREKLLKEQGDREKIQRQRRENDVKEKTREQEQSRPDQSPRDLREGPWVAIGKATVVISILIVALLSFVGKGTRGRADPRPPEPTPTVSQGLSRSEVEEFVERFIRTTNSGDVEAVVSLYAEKVDYFNAGVVDADFVRADKSRYYQRWTDVHFRLLGDVSFVPTADTNLGIAEFDFEYTVRNDVRSATKSGRARNTLKVQRNGNNIVIIDEKQKVRRNG